MKTIKELKNIYQGKDIWLIAGGSSMDFIDPSFYENKITIGLNHVYKKYKCNYIIMKDLYEDRFKKGLYEIMELGLPLIYSEHNMAWHTQGKNYVDYDNSYMFSHNDGAGPIEGALEVIGTDRMACKRSGITCGMNIAAYMGAKNIIISGVDCGRINNNLYFKGYTEKQWHSGENDPNIENWLTASDKINLTIRDKIKEVYNCNIHSLNPFMNLKLDGNDFKPC
tara:strand:+ start:264 stop:935 length:672 start_codon:yes stop_codon:yes gene_type:complete